LVVHVGHGRTGSSSVQRTMLESLEQLEGQGIFFLGLVLERVDVGEGPAWQYAYGSPELFTMPPEVAAQEVYDVLAAGLAQARQAGASTAVWSNEWILQREAFVLPALARLRAEGVDVSVVAYVRRHDDWARSAYIQWGIKHKTYPGIVRPFAEWKPAFGEDNFEFAPVLEPWAQAFGSSFHLFNFDAVDDVVQHLLALIGVEGVPTYDANASAPPEVLTANAVFNSMTSDQVMPDRFEFHHQRAGNPLRLPQLDHLMPTSAELEALVAASAEDIAAVDALLAERGQPTLDFSRPLEPVVNPTADQSVAYLTQMVSYLAEEIRVLTQELKGQQALVERLRRRVNRQADPKKS
jgi:hypothetical protein